MKGKFFSSMTGFLMLCILFLGAMPQKASAVSITVKGTASGFDLTATKKEAVFNARKALLKEHQKIILSWASICYSDVDFNFESIAQKVSLKASAMISREKVKKRKNGYTVTVYLSYGVDNKTITSEMLDSFERNLLPGEKKKINYNHDKAWKSLYDVVKRW